MTFRLQALHDILFTGRCGGMLQKKAQTILIFTAGKRGVPPPSCSRLLEVKEGIVTLLCQPGLIHRMCHPCPKDNVMKSMFVISMALAAAALVPASAQARNYDCTKAGNATKAACSGAANTAPAKTAAAKPAPAKAAAATPVQQAAPRSTAAAAPRNYDCSKAGNANKAVCKGATTAAKPIAYGAPATVARPTASRPAAVASSATVARPGAPTVAWTTKTGKVVHYDCSKAGNQTKQACKG